MLHCPIHHKAKFKVFMVTRDKNEEIYRMPQRTLYAVHNHERCQLEPLFYCHAADADARKEKSSHDHTHSSHRVHKGCARRYTGFTSATLA